MAAKRPRRGSLQFYPRKRAAKILPSANWTPVVAAAKEEGLLGFIAYKAGMATAIVRDNTDKVMSSKKQVAMPVTILEVPAMKVYSVRFYKNGIPLTEIVVSNDRELKRYTRVAKSVKTLDKVPEHYDDIRVIVYSLPKQTSIKKTPDMIELAVKSDNQLEFVKGLIGRELTVKDFLKGNLLDVRGLTKGKGTQGPMKRFGIARRSHKAEKGVRKPGSIGPWHPARLTFKTPMAGQLGLFSRIVYNLNVLSSGAITEKDINPSHGFKHYGKIRSNYLILKGSVPGPSKRQMLLTPSFRPSKEQSKRKYELVEVLA